MRLDTEAERDARLARMKWRATGLLVLAGGLYAGAQAFEHQYPSLYWLSVTAEASMVGAIADWFAVTALFHHPLGMPVPHTALIPRRKDELGRSLEEFVGE